MTTLAISGQRVSSGALRRAAHLLFDAPQVGAWRGWGFAVAALSYLAVIARATVLGYAFALPAALVLGPEIARAGLGRLYVTLCFVAFEELARLGYAWRAHNKSASLVAFFVLTVAVENLAYFKGQYGLGVYLASRAPSVLVHLFSTVVLIAAFRRPRWILPAFALALSVHVAFDYWAPSIVTFLTGLDHVHLPATRHIGALR
jgi:hypothetical protein